MSTLTTIEALEKGKRMSQLAKDITDLENRMKHAAIYDIKTATSSQQLLAEKKAEYELLKKQLWDLKPSGEDEEDQD